MSLPILNSALVQRATRLAGDVANRVGNAIGFDDVLRESVTGPSIARGASITDAASLTGQLVEGVRLRLAQAGITTNQSLRLSVRGDGGMLVEGDHPRAAEIEAILSMDAGLAETAKKLHRTSGGSRAAIRLTIPSEPGNILQATGGYPNW